MADQLKDGLVRRGNTWSYVLRVIDPATGKSRPRWVGGFATRKEAKDARDKARAERATGTLIAQSRTTVAAYLRQRWLPAVEVAGLRATTLRGYKLHVEQHVIPHIGGVRLQSVTPELLNTLYADLLDHGSRNGAPLAPASVRKVHAVCRKAFSDAQRWQLLPRNPADGANPPRQQKGTKHDLRTWSASELRQFLGFVADDRVYPLWLLLASTGMRRGEVVGLRWRDVNFRTRTVSIQHTAVAVGYKVQYSPPKTSRGRRSVSLDRQTVEVLKAWKATQKAEQRALGAPNNTPTFVFTGPTGEPLHPDRVSKLFDRRVADSGLPRIRLHDLRHTHATLGLAAGVPAKIMSERLGHSTVAFTLDVYTHAVPGLQADAAELVANLVFDYEEQAEDSDDEDG